MTFGDFLTDRSSQEGVWGDEKEPIPAAHPDTVEWVEAVLHSHLISSAILTPEIYYSQNLITFALPLLVMQQLKQLKKL